MNLIAISIRRPVFAWILMSALIIFGAICFNRLGVSQMPDIDFPVINIAVTYEGASPEVVEAELIDPIEQELLSIEGITEMRSSVRQGSGQVTLNFDINRNVDVALQEVQTALSSIRYPLNVDPPRVRKQNPEESPIMFIGVASKKPLRETITWADNYLLDQFRFLPGIGEVSLSSSRGRNLRVWPNQEKLKKADMTIADLLDAVKSQHLEASAGQFSDGKEEFRVRWMGEAADADQVGNIRIMRRGGQVIQDRVYRIKDVADVENGLTDFRSASIIDGKDAVSISIKKQRGSNEVVLAETVRKQVEKLQKTIPKDYQLQVNIDLTRPTEAVVHTTQHKLIIAALVTIVICFFFLGSWSAALNILFSIPVSIVGTCMILYFSGFTLNLFTLLALTLAISIVVDDAIMLLENIVRHYHMGKSPPQAAYDGAMEILPAATAATLAVVAVFLPVIFMSGITGKFFFQFGVTMSAAVLLSLLEAVTITPMRSAAFLALSPKPSRFENFLEVKFHKLGEFYQKLLGFTIHWSKAVVVASLVLFVASLWLVKGLRQEFVPQQDQNIIFLNTQLPPSASIEATAAKGLEIAKILDANKNISRYFMNIGSGMGASNVNQMSFPIALIPREERSVTHLQVMDQIRQELKKVKDTRNSLRDISARGLTSGRQNPVSFNLRGPDLKILQAKGEEIMGRLNKEGLTQDLDTDFKLGLPELLVRPNRDKMASRGVSIEKVAQVLNSAVAGIRQNQITEDGRRFDIRFKLHDSEIRSPKDIEMIDVRNDFGLRVPMSQLVEFENRETYQSITRVNRQRAIGVFGNVAGGAGQGQVLERAEQIAHEILPAGYDFSLEGSAAGLSESFKSLGVALILGILVAYMILAVQFNSFVHPVSILAALPFSMTGALLVLWLSGVSLNLFSFIGLIVLMGIAKKNSILLVEFTNHVRESGQKDIRKAILEACPVRLRPILMTSVATVAAATPLIFGNSIGQETRTPMGLTIAGGTIISTFFTLFVVPCLYLVLSRFESKKRNHFVVETTAAKSEPKNEPAGAASQLVSH
jgi:hydrophobe/amphiphile efflux-1 (HAE1) family protein